MRRVAHPFWKHLSPDEKMGGLMFPMFAKQSHHLTKTLKLMLLI
jgi:hypothetical protein